MQERLNKLREAAKDKDKGIELLYFDETGIANVPHVQRSWSPLGEAHSADASIARKRVNVLGALNYAAGTLAFEVHEHTVCRADVVNFLDRQARDWARDKLTVVVMDNASIHHNIEQDILHQWMVRDRFVLLFLPPYSPELNLIEILWKQAKYHWREFVTWAAKDLRKEVLALFDGFGTKFNFSYTRGHATADPSSMTEFFSGHQKRGNLQPNGIERSAGARCRLGGQPVGQGL
jgi:DDE superfamily endonuclease